MRKLKLDPERLEVESFESAGDEETVKGTVEARSSEVAECYTQYCVPPTGDPRQRLCYTPYYDCATNGWTCDYCGG
ncbi:MAG TPA: hypothetical protein VFQ39_09205 [Longimicrobium sp.]|nr:hypothetical protein [Longimicrobium sp.]